MRFWLSALCVVLLGHWWHAVAMPSAPMNTAHGASHAMTTGHHASAHSHSVTTEVTEVAEATAAPHGCCDHSTPPLLKMSCGGEHACCTLQATPVASIQVPAVVRMPALPHAHAPTLTLQAPKARLFKPPKTLSLV